MITTYENLIPTNGGSNAVIEKFLTNIEVDYVEINPRLRTEEFYKRQRRKPQEGIPYEDTQVKTQEVEFVPMAEFVKVITHDEIKQQEETMRDEEEYNTLIEAFIRSKMHEAYDKYTNQKPRDFSFTMDVTE
jgi:hypothetical protein